MLVVETTKLIVRFRSVASPRAAPMPAGAGPTATDATVWRKREPDEGLAATAPGDLAGRAEGAEEPTATAAFDDGLADEPRKAERSRLNCR